MAQGLTVGSEVVSYRNSTSNHNERGENLEFQRVVSYRNSTSNHNFVVFRSFSVALYLIEIPHQTTTRAMAVCCLCRCILSKFHIKPQLCCSCNCSTCCCILSKFHIKPQLSSVLLIWFIVVSYRNSTSNHNQRRTSYISRIVVSYRNSTSNHNLCRCLVFRLFVVSYRNSTSNHNANRRIHELEKLYLIEIPHQTTTVDVDSPVFSALYLIEIPHQTTTRTMSCFNTSMLYLIEIPHQTTTLLT